MNKNEFVTFHLKESAVKVSVEDEERIKSILHRRAGRRVKHRDEAFAIACSFRQYVQFATWNSEFLRWNLVSSLECLMER